MPVTRSGDGAGRRRHRRRVVRHRHRTVAADRAATRQRVPAVTVPLAEALAAVNRPRRADRARTVVVQVKVGWVVKAAPNWS